MEGQSVRDADKDGRAVDAMLSGLTDLEATTQTLALQQVRNQHQQAKASHTYPTQPQSKCTTKGAKAVEGKKPASKLHPPHTSDSET